MVPNVPEALTNTVGLVYAAARREREANSARPLEARQLIRIHLSVCASAVFRDGNHLSKVTKTAGVVP